MALLTLDDVHRHHPDRPVLDGVSFVVDDDTRVAVWNRFARAPAPVGYDPAIIPGWTSPTCDDFAAIELDPWLLRVFPGTMLLEGRGEVHTWSDPAA